MKAISLSIAGLIVALAVACSAREAQAQAGDYPVQGVWEASYVTPWGMAHERLVLMHNGSFSKLFECADKKAYFSGSYVEGPGFIRFYHDRGPIRTETTWVRFDGPNRMICEDRIMGTHWVAERAGP